MTSATSSRVLATNRGNVIDCRDAKLCWEDLDRVPVVVGPKMTICHLAESIKKVYYGTKCLQLLVKAWFENDAATKIVTF